MRPFAAVAALVLSLATAGCGEDALSEEDLENEVKTELTRQVGQAPKEIDCPGDLKAEKGEKMTCTLVADDGSRVDTFVTVTSAEDGKAKFDIQVDDQVRR
jgi:hypothetical protein